MFLYKKTAQKILYLAADLLNSFANNVGWEENSYKIIGSTTGDKLEYLNAKHPFFDRNSLIILGDTCHY